MESPLRGDALGGFGGRVGETGRERSRYRAPARPLHQLHGPAKWSYFYLYVILDIYSRYVVDGRVSSPV